jgi:UDP-N-acetyl-D-mannosaminuronic acid dehydrogenase
VDPWFFVEAAPELTPLIYHSRRVNDSQPQFVVEIVQDSLGSLQGKKIAALGLAYKPEVDDLRESPALEVIRILRERGAQVRAWEPYKPDAALEHAAMASSLEDAVRDADAILLLVKHGVFSRLVPEEISQRTKARIVIDAVNGWDAEQWRNAGFSFTKLGAG